MNVLIEPGESKNVLTTIAIGEEYYNSWEQFAFPTWKKYCERNDLGLIVFDTDLLPKDSTIWKKPNWQKLLIGHELKINLPNVSNVCFLDTDILINFMAPNIFDSYNPDTIGLVSLHQNLPYPREEVLRRLAFLRHSYYDNNYPLDSALFISLDRLYEFHGLASQKNEACTGLIMFNVSRHAETLRNWFSKYDRHLTSITGGGEQTHVNFEMLKWGNISWFNYKFQAMWVFEMAWKYPFLYEFGRENKVLIRECIEASLFTNYFLHFAGSWYESEMWKVGGVLEDLVKQETFEGFSEYEKLPVTGEPVGIIKPKD